MPMCYSSYNLRNFTFDQKIKKNNCFWNDSHLFQSFETYNVMGYFINILFFYIYLILNVTNASKENLSIKYLNIENLKIERLSFIYVFSGSNLPQ